MLKGMIESSLGFRETFRESIQVLRHTLNLKYHLAQNMSWADNDAAQFSSLVGFVPRN